MGGAEELVSSPLFIVGAIVAGVVVVAVLVLLSKRQQAKTVEGYAKARNYTAAAALAQKEGDFDTALEYHLLGGQPELAAKLAHRIGRLRQAAEIYQSAGDTDAAVAMYKEAGLTREARELMGQTDADGPKLSDDGEDSRDSTTDFLTPKDRARRAVKRFRVTLARSEHGDVEAQAQTQELAREAAEACLSAGLTQEAADVFRDAGLTDQAINLYVNILGDSASAARLFAERGDHQRAAALFEAAGKKQRALASWLRWAENADDPLLHLEEVERLGDTAGQQLLDTVVQQRPLNDGTADLFYRVAEAYESRKRTEAAMSVLQQLDKTLPGYRDVSQKITELRVVITTERKQVARQVEGGGGRLLPDTSGGGPVVLDDGPAEIDDRPHPDAPQSRGPGDRRPPPTVAGPPISLDDPDSGPPLDQLEAHAIERLVGEVASAVAKEAVKLARPSTEAAFSSEPDVAVMRRHKRSTARRAEKALAQGLESKPVNIVLAVDPIVEAARSGPSIRELQDLIGGQPADLGNIEVYYRLGLAQAAAGQWREAMRAFIAVEETSPGYRDAERRAAELSQWADAVGTGKTSAVSERYTLLGEIGRGGMAVVYRARDMALGREVALKFLSEEVSNHEGMLELFQREARSAAQLNHPNIVTLYDVGTLQGRAFISMELVEGHTVESLLDEQGTLKVFDTLCIAENILSALEYAHGKQIVHRDIKPSNMMRNELGVVKLMDFGLAKSIGGRAKTTMVAGTPLYMAPEQFTGKDVNYTTDVFAIGATLYEMLAGHPPFEGMRRDIAPAPLEEENPAVPKLLAKTIHRAMELEQGRRFAHAGAMLKPTRHILEAVRGYLSGASPSPHPE